jgi:xylan 1,4-beta-xylosidase
MARSKNIDGPYETDPQNPVLTSYDNPELKLQRAGHASLVETQNGEWYMAHLCGRHIPSRGRCTMGRETAIQKMAWTNDGWLRLEYGGNEPLEEVPAPRLPLHEWDKEPIRDDFNSEKLNINFQFLRMKLGEDTFSLTERPGFLRLKGKESLNSHHTQALIARRQQSFFYTAETCLDFQPDTFQQMAGLICLYDNRNFYYIYITWEEDKGRCVDIISSKDAVTEFLLDEKLSIPDEGFYYLKAHVYYDKLRFYHSSNGKDWKQLGPTYDYSTLSDEFEAFGGDAHFTGSFVGICCQDLSGRKKVADFDYFEYKERQ